MNENCNCKISLHPTLVTILIGGTAEGLKLWVATLFWVTYNLLKVEKVCFLFHSTEEKGFTEY